ncbi:MAG: hypothetical protein JWM96_950 [Alphaproteobacteria bacterium]|nr:hypothetical protein [Alphaproteobacteria bacterium]
MSDGVEGNPAYEYTGKNELILLSEMKIYNNHLAALCSRYIDKNMHVLDFGAGAGDIAQLVQARTTAVITCIELDHEHAQILARKDFTVYARADQCETNSFDAIYSSNVLEHVPDQVSALKELHRVLRPSGVAAFWVPAFPLLWTELDDRVEHQRRYTRKTLESAFKEAGFVVERSFYQDSLGFFIALLVKLVERTQQKQQKIEMITKRNIFLYDRVLFPLSKLADYLFHPFFGKNVFIYARKSG